jgi:hypothetical protein
MQAAIAHVHAIDNGIPKRPAALNDPATHDRKSTYPSADMPVRNMVRTGSGISVDTLAVMSLRISRRKWEKMTRAAGRGGGPARSAAERYMVTRARAADAVRKDMRVSRKINLSVLRAL